MTIVAPAREVVRVLVVVGTVVEVVTGVMVDVPGVDVDVVGTDVGTSESFRVLVVAGSEIPEEQPPTTMRATSKDTALTHQSYKGFPAPRRPELPRSCRPGLGPA